MNPAGKGDDEPTLPTTDRQGFKKPNYYPEAPPDPYYYYPSQHRNKKLILGLTIALFVSCFAYAGYVLYIGFFVVPVYPRIKISSLSFPYITISDDNIQADDSHWTIGFHIQNPDLVMSCVGVAFNISIQYQGITLSVTNKVPNPEFFVNMHPNDETDMQTPLMATWENYVNGSLHDQLKDLAHDQNDKMVTVSVFVYFKALYDSKPYSSANIGYTYLCDNVTVSFSSSSHPGKLVVDDGDQHCFPDYEQELHLNADEVEELLRHSMVRSHFESIQVGVGILLWPILFSAALILRSGFM